MDIDLAFPICPGTDIAVMPWHNYPLLLQSAEMRFQLLPQAFIFVGIGVEHFQWSRHEHVSFNLHALAEVYPISSVIAIEYQRKDGFRISPTSNGLYLQNDRIQ
jgi:hypothetical protein